MRAADLQLLGRHLRAGADLSVEEDSVIDPISPYARTKAVCEAMFADIAASQHIRVLSLRYFNPIGVDPKMRPMHIDFGTVQGRIR